MLFKPNVTSWAINIQKARPLLPCRRQWVHTARRGYATQGADRDTIQTPRIRNIGIIAHIDAGKTTTTERMLYYSGYTQRIGDVDDGSTVTDFLPAERARGITIQSAAITFDWPPKPSGPEPDSLLQSVEDGALPRSAISHNINLIDTPGHADFTFEVRRSLRILDGAVCILDGVAGVEAQSEQVWKQAGEWGIPRIVFVNKLDRDGAEFGTAVRDVASKLGAWPAICQIPWWEGGNGRFTGIADVVSLRGLLYPEGGDGKMIKAFSLQELENKEPTLAEELKKARVALIELLSEHDDQMVDVFLESNEDHLAIPDTAIWTSLRVCLLAAESKIIPVFAGASFRNIGVQPLLDSVINLLPDPSERPEAEVSLGTVKGGLKELLDDKFVLPATSSGKSHGHRKGSKATATPPSAALEGCALAFKVVNDPRKGVLVYVRVYSGTLNRGAMLFNTNLNVSEKATTLLKIYASDSVMVPSIEAGQIGVITGLKYARTGDTLITWLGNKGVPPEPFNRLQLRPIEVPPPVFFASIEPHSLSDQKDMQDKLALLLREDPSLHVSKDEDSGQMLISGMGELHLEIARNRLVDDMKAKATMGQIEIGYLETITAASEETTDTSSREIAGKKSRAGCTARVEPYNPESASPPEAPVGEDVEIHTEDLDGNHITIISPQPPESSPIETPDYPSLTPGLTLSQIRSAYTTGALAALSRGPSGLYAVRNVAVTLRLDPETHLFGGESSLAALTNAARSSTTQALHDAAQRGSGTTLLEPVMDVTYTVDEASLGAVVNDISSNRGGHVYSLDDDDDDDSDDSDAEGAVSERSDGTDSTTGADTNTLSSAPIDLRRVYAPPDPFGSRSRPSPLHADGAVGESGEMGSNPRTRTVKAKVPLKEMVGYLKVLRSLTGGRGTFVMSVDRFEKMTRRRQKMVIGR